MLWWAEYFVVCASYTSFLKMDVTSPVDPVEEILRSMDLLTIELRKGEDYSGLMAVLLRGIVLLEGIVLLDRLHL